MNTWIIITAKMIIIWSHNISFPFVCCYCFTCRLFLWNYIFPLSCGYHCTCRPYWLDCPTLCLAINCAQILLSSSPFNQTQTVSCPGEKGRGVSGSFVSLYEWLPDWSGILLSDNKHVNGGINVRSVIIIPRCSRWSPSGYLHNQLHGWNEKVKLISYRYQFYSTLFTSIFLFPLLRHISVFVIFNFLLRIWLPLRTSIKNSVIPLLCHLCVFVIFNFQWGIPLLPYPCVFPFHCDPRLLLMCILNFIEWSLFCFTCPFLDIDLWSHFCLSWLFTHFL